MIDRDAATDEVEVAIIGSGFSGIGMAVMLLRAGITSFVVLEKAREVGGTWRENTYPGAACDVPSHLYSFSFEPNPTWSRAFSGQAEILDYLRHCARKYGVVPYVRFGAEVASATWDEPQSRWVVVTRDGRAFRARSIVMGKGALHVPSLPAIPGQDTFAGPQFHSAKWNPTVDLAGKTVAVIGTGASAIQFVPAIAPRVAKLALFQRTPPWIIPKPDRAISAVEQSVFARIPGVQKLVRGLTYWGLEWRAAAFVVDTRLAQAAEGLSKRYLAKTIKDGELRKKLTPQYRLGCKRVLLSNDYYPALARDNVDVITDAIERITPTGVRTTDGVEHPVDVIVYGTGFDVAHYVTPMRVVGRSGHELGEKWGQVPETYLGITTSGFPNLYLLMGPNTGLGHNSMIFMIEAQARYALQCIQALRDRGLRALDVKETAQAGFMREVETRAKDTVWQAGGCRSWYQNDAGRNIALWPGFTVEYWLRTRRVEFGDYTEVV